MNLWNPHISTFCTFKDHSFRYEATFLTKPGNLSDEAVDIYEPAYNDDEI